VQHPGAHRGVSVAGTEITAALPGNRGRFGIEGGRARAGLRIDLFEDAECIRRIFEGGAC